MYTAFSFCNDSIMLVACTSCMATAFGYVVPHQIMGVAEIMDKTYWCCSVWRNVDGNPGAGTTWISEISSRLLDASQVPYHVVCPTSQRPQYLRTKWHQHVTGSICSQVFEEYYITQAKDSWHHVLKGKFLEGRRNRQIDHLIHILVDEVISYYKLKDQRRDGGFDGPDLQAKKREAILLASRAIMVANIAVSKIGSTITEDIG